MSDGITIGADRSTIQATFESINNQGLKSKSDVEENENPLSTAEDAKYWQARYEKLLNDYNHLQKINQNLEEKLLDVADTYQKKNDELVANNEFEKSTLMADVNKLSTKLVDARIKLHDYEEKELLHASECSSPCHKNCNENTRTAIAPKDQTSMNYDPNLV